MPWPCDEARYSELLERIYEGVTDPLAWSMAMDAFARAAGEDAVSMLVRERERGAPIVAVGPHAELLPRLLSAQARGVAADAGFPGSWLHSMGHQQLELYLLFHSQEPSEDRRQNSLDLVTEAAAHILRAAGFAQRLDSVATRGSALLSVLDHLPYGVLVVTGSMDVMHANRNAERILQAGDGLARDGDRITAGRPDNTQQLRDAVHAVATSATDSPGEQIVRIAREGSPLPYTVIVVAAADHPLAQPFLDSDPSTSILFVMDPDRHLDVPADIIANLHALTLSEARLALAIANGQTIEEIADARGVSPHTARTQLKRVFAKTGVHRQAELVKLILLGPTYWISGSLLAGSSD